MGCLSLHIERVGGASLDTSRMGGCSISAQRIGGLEMSVTFVCSIRQGVYLRVIPAEPMWIDVGLDVNYSVRSNTDWTVN